MRCRPLTRAWITVGVLTQRSPSASRWALCWSPAPQAKIIDAKLLICDSPFTKMLRVGLTGSIAVGKSFVAGVLAELGCHVLDADATARAVVAAGTPGLHAIVENFGREVLQPDGTLDRARLGAIVFADENQ